MKIKLFVDEQMYPFHRARNQSGLTGHSQTLLGHQEFSRVVRGVRVSACEQFPAWRLKPANEGLQARPARWLIGQVVNLLVLTEILTQLALYKFGSSLLVNDKPLTSSLHWEVQM